MKIQFLGAAQTVTGSCYMIEANGHRFTVDCGMHQGNDEIEKRNSDLTVYDPARIDCVLLTHAHIDHSGLLPGMVKHGFKGPIYTTPPTSDLLDIMLLDSAHIQESEAEWKNRKRRRQRKKLIEPIYTQKDAENTLPLFSTVEYREPFSPLPGVTVTYRDAGHILGSAFLELKVEENGDTYRMVFSGDLGRPDQLLLNDPGDPNPTDFLFVESTYGDRNHKNEESSRDELAEAIAYSYKNGEKVIIPAFAVERTQEMIYSLFLL
ncbi:MAG: MBL fold metallo-hydrolase, partial [Desulfovibrio sp.]